MEYDYYVELYNGEGRMSISHSVRASYVQFQGDFIVFYGEEGVIVASFSSHHMLSMIKV